MNRESQASRLAACDEDLGQLAAEVTELSSELAELREHGHALTRDVAEREARLGEQEVTLVRVEQERAEWQRRAETATTAMDTLNREVAVREDELRTLRARVEEQDSGSRGLMADRGHVVMITLPTGYDLGFSDQPCPSPGDVVEIEGRSYRVERTGRAPLPGDALPCAFVTPARL